MMHFPGAAEGCKPEESRLKTVKPCLLFAVLSGIALLFSLGCRNVDSPPESIAARFIEQNPEEILSPEMLGIGRQGLGFDFSSPEIARSWHLEDQQTVTPEGLHFSSEIARLVGDIELDAEQVYTMDAHLSSAHLEVALLDWATSEETFSTKRRIKIKVDRNEATPQSIRFPVADHPLWKGHIAKLRLTFRLQPGGKALLQTLVANPATMEKDRLPQILDRPYKVELANDVRGAYLSVPGLAIRRQLTVPEQARLRFAYGFLEHLQRPVTYRVLLADDGGEDLLFEQTLNPEDTSEQGWHPGSVDLTPYAGRDVELRLETVSAAAPADLQGFAVWANPEVVSVSANPPPPNVVLISMDTLRADHLSLYGYHRPTTPHLDTWLRRSGVGFRHAIAQAPWTLPSHTSMLSGMNALHHGVNHNSPVPLALTLLPEHLRKQGYKTLAVTGGAYLHPRYNLGQGFDRLEYWPGRIVGPERPEDEGEIEYLVGQASNWLEEHAQEPFFLFFHSYDVHHRSQPREPYFKRFSSLEAPPKIRINSPKPLPEEGFLRSRHVVLAEGANHGTPLPAELVALPADIYDSRIAYMDQAIVQLLEKLESLGIAERTLVVFTSDHGEMLGEHGGMYDHLSLYDETLRVPLLVGGNGIVARDELIEQQVRSIDIVPTILDYLEIPPWPEVEGRSLRSLIKNGSEEIDREAWSYASVSNFGLSLRRENRLKIILNNSIWPQLIGKTELYDLARDPAELASDLSRTGLVGELRRRLAKEYLESIPGLRVRFSNQQRDALRWTLQGGPVRSGATKSVEFDCRCAEWLGPGKLALTVPGESTFTLVFEDVKSDYKSFSVSVGPEKLWRRVVDLESLRESPLALEFTGSGWQPAVGVPGTGMEIWWQGSAQASAPAPEDDDEELRKRLEALGYL